MRAATLSSLRRATTGVAVLILLTASCGSGDARDGTAGGAFEVRDSAGVQLVTNGQPDRPLPLREVLRVGLMEGDPDYLFRNIRSLTPDPAGGFRVVDSNEGVRHYTADGDYVGSVGGRGSGPGESEMYYSATLDGERVLLFGVPGVLQLFDDDGTLLTSAGPNPGGGSVSPVGVVDGTWIMQQRGYAGDGSTVFRGTTTFLRSGSLDGPRDTIRTFTGQLNREAGGGRVRHVGRAS
jgi:hypothetical protein